MGSETAYRNPSSLPPEHTGMYLADGHMYMWVCGPVTHNDIVMLGFLFHIQYSIFVCLYNEQEVIIDTEDVHAVIRFLLNTLYSRVDKDFYWSYRDNTHVGNDICSGHSCRVVLPHS